MEENYNLAKWLNNDLSDAELKEIQQDDDFMLLEKIKTHSSLLEASAFNKQKMLSEILATKKEPKVVPLYKNTLLKIAAIIVLCFGFLFSLYQFNNETILASSKMNVTLPDNSLVALNENASVEYNKLFWSFNRKVNLNGEAYFKVQKGEKFQVITQNGTVSVLGTQFNVKAKNEIFEVTCYEGKVKVEASNQTSILTKGMVVSLNQNKLATSTTTLAQPSWKNEAVEITFENEKLNVILTEIEKNYNVKITTNASSEQTFTGKIPTHDLDVALQIIASTYHLEILTNDSKEYELKVQ